MPKEDFLTVQWLRLHTSSAEGTGSVSGQELRSGVPCGMASKGEVQEPVCPLQRESEKASWWRWHLS